jgi:hypothetical protein
MKFLITATVSMFLLASSQVFADASNCTDKFEVFDNTTVQTLPGNTGCFVTVNPRNIYDLIYRSFLFDDAGLFMIFDSLGAGSDVDTTGAREFYFFPRKTNQVNYQYDAPSKRLSVKTPSGKIFVFNTEKAILVSVTGSSLTIDYAVDGKNKGGVEFVKNDGLYLDLGFTFGQSPSQNPSRKVSFSDTNKNSCVVKNSAIFKYSAEQDSTFKYTDLQLNSFLKRNCPQLKF